MATITSPFDRSLFILLNAGFSLAFCTKYIVILFSRRSYYRDALPASLLGCWLVYIVIQLIDTWATLSTGTIRNFSYVLALSTLLNSACLCGIAYMSVVRVLALTVARNTSVFRRVAYGFIGLVFLVRLVRTCLLFAVAAQLNASNNAVAVYLNGIVSIMQFLTLLPILVGRTILDFISTWQLWKFRVKYMDSGRDAFYTIAISLVVETVLSHIAIVVSAEEALVSFFRISIPNMLAVTDWLLISWCLASWIEQRPLYRQIFNQPESSGPTSAAANKSADLTMVGYEGEMMHQRNDLPSATQSYNQGSANFEDLSNPPRYQATTYQPNGNQGQQYLGGGRFTTRS